MVTDNVVLLSRWHPSHKLSKSGMASSSTMTKDLYVQWVQVLVLFCFTPLHRASLSLLLILLLPRCTPALPTIRSLLFAAAPLELETTLTLSLFRTMPLKYKTLLGMCLGYFS